MEFTTRPPLPVKKAVVIQAEIAVESKVMSRKQWVNMLSCIFDELHTEVRSGKRHVMLWNFV